MSEIKTKFKIIFAFALIFSLLLVNTVYAEDSGSEEITSDSFDSIQNLVDGANSGDSICLHDGEFLGNGSAVNIQKDITLYGNSSRTILNAANKSAIFVISKDVSVNLVGITFKNGYSNSYGGAIDNLGKLNIVNATFIKNNAYNGGAIYNKNTLTIANVSASNNKASLNGGFIYNAANLIVDTLNSNLNEARFGGVIYNDDFAWINNSKFNSNKATEAGAIYSASNLIVDNSQFSYNQISRQGGALSLRGDNVDIHNSVFSYNSGADEGGCIFNYDADVYVNGSKFLSNTAKSYGAAIDNGGQLTVENSLFDKNRAYGAGAIDNGGLLKISSSNFTNNKATVNGGAIDSNGNMNVTGCIFENNGAGGNGGAVIARRCTTVSHSIFLSNYDANGYAVFNNTYDKISFMNNWWGSNSPDFDRLFNFNVSDDFTWIKMNLDNDSSFIQGKTMLINVSFNQVVNKNNSLFKLESSNLLPIFKVVMSNGDTLVVRNGSVSKSISIPKTNLFTVKTNDEILIFNVSADLDNIKRITGNKNIVEDYKGTTSFKVRAIGDDGKPVGKNVIVKMKIGKNSYDVKTDSKGYATKNIALLPGKYTVTTTYKGYSVKNTITIKNVLVAKSTTKKKAKNIKYSVTLKNSKKKAIVGKKIIFKVSGKTYFAKTDYKGIASVNLKNLKIGKYSITVKYLNYSIKTTLNVKK